MVKIIVAALVAGAVADPQWEQYKIDFKKTYASDSEESERYAIFKDTLDRIEKLNAKGNPVFGLTWTSDRKDHEKHAKGYKRPAGFVPTAPIYEKKQAVRSPAGINWRFTEAITPIKNQGQCVLAGLSLRLQPLSLLLPSSAVRNTPLNWPHSKSPAAPRPQELKGALVAMVASLRVRTSMSRLWQVLATASTSHMSRA